MMNEEPEKEDGRSGGAEVSTQAGVCMAECTGECTGDSGAGSFIEDGNMVDCAGNLYERPSDDAIIAQENAIRAEENEKLDLIGDKEPLSLLETEYESGSAVFQAKINKLCGSYGWIRRARRDGNCFFRSFMFAFLEHLLESMDSDAIDHILKRLTELRQSLLGQGFAELTFEDFLAQLQELVQAVRPGTGSTVSLSKLVEYCRDESISNCVVMCFRFFTSSEIQRRAEFFEPFIFGVSNMGVLQFCRCCVEPMGVESDHVHIIALSDALGVPVRVVYLDGSSSCGSDTSAEVNIHDFIPKETSSDKKKAIEGTQAVPAVVLLYRPGHYDILYSK